MKYLLTRRRLVWEKVPLSFPNDEVSFNSEETRLGRKSYAKINIGKEPLDWLVSVCKSCHYSQHR